MHTFSRYAASTLSAALIATGIGHAQAAEPPYYNPANAASQTGFTIGYELYKTIGCPARGLLESPCKEPTPTPVKPMPADDDKDGVVNSLDKCPNTPSGRKVNAQGCELDGDGDGVVDGLDKCPDTPAGRKVNAQGCEPDSDGDGIIDALDQCPDTPKGDKVDSKGCTLAETIVLKGVNFDSDSANLRPESSAILDDAVATLKRYPQLRIEVAGHTDSSHTDAHNLILSKNRAQAVSDYFVQHGIDAARLVPKGYGESQPVADNATIEGRAVNRRVEMRLQR